MSMTRRADVDEDDEAVLIYRGIFLGHKKKEIGDPYIPWTISRP